ncbi:glycine betaine ABC transporter substrate-binding protein [Methanogenium marinum]|uniref:Glycine betaine ABC transporter substrate-binding protein n=1 Tax=Methanogenium marinum TaxID=348610 RepID=A0A9Q4KU03_9EURY|nr:glycine betaine ABC transporter substrate-binding protein [Methanogenium marinum]MDE4907170.1 glycine betaine ABC transporter substrate-binding protein [Methanogenium marinum]
MLSAILVVGCTNNAAEPTKEVSIGYILWDTEIASVNVLKNVYEQAGYDVELDAVDVGPLYQALSDGKVDMTISSWMPTAQASYWDTYGDSIDDVGTNLDGVKIGLVVPSYVTIDSIDELNSVADKFDNEITGVEPGAGMMGLTEKAIEDYNLDYTLLASSCYGMEAELTDAYAKEEWIVIIGWTPHWMFVRYDLKFLEDPWGLYGGEEHLESLARLGFKEDDPEAYAILERFHWTIDDMESVLFAVEDGATPEDAAQAWIDANPETVNYWING